MRVSGHFDVAPGVEPLRALHAVSNRPRRPRKWLATVALAVVAASALSAHAAEDAPIPPKSERAPEVRLRGDVVTLPVVMVREFPFIESSIAGVRGKLMLDTGAEQALSVNDRRVSVSNAREIGRGMFGSGQSFAMRLVPELRDVDVAGHRFPRATTVEAQDARMLEGITPDFLGWFGYTAFSNHAMKLDYRTLRATFYRYGTGDYLKGERVIAKLSFETRRLPNIPVMPGRIGDMPVATIWDTGQNGVLHTSEVGMSKLLKEGRLRPSQIRPNSFDVHDVQLNGYAIPVLRGVDVETTPFPASRPIGITESNILSIGYVLLRQYKTIWDYRQRRIILLASDMEASAAAVP